MRRRSLESYIGIHDVRRYATLQMTLGSSSRKGGQAAESFGANVNERRLTLLSDALSFNPGGSLFVNHRQKCRKISEVPRGGFFGRVAHTPMPDGPGSPWWKEMMRNEEAKTMQGTPRPVEPIMTYGIPIILPGGRAEGRGF